MLLGPLVDNGLVWLERLDRRTQGASVRGIDGCGIAALLGDTRVWLLPHPVPTPTPKPTPHRPRAIVHSNIKVPDQLFLGFSLL